MEGNFEFDDDDGDNYVQTRRLNILLTDTGFGSNASRSAEQAVSSASVKRLYGRSGKIHLLKCLQYVLKRVTPQVANLLYPHLEESAMDTFKKELMVATKILWVHFVSKSLAGHSLRLAELYAIIFLAIRLLNMYPVYVDDMISILKQNKVPYISALSLLPKQMLQLLSAATVSQLTSSATPVDDLFYNYLSKLAPLIAPAKLFHTPVEYYYPNAFSLFTDLELDAPTLIVVFHRIASRASTGLLRSFLKSNGPLGFPDGRHIGLMYLTIKLYFVGSPVVVDMDAWLPWLKNQGSTIPCFDDRFHHMNTDTILSLSDEQTDKYCNWIFNNLLDEKHKEDSDKTSPMDSRLYKIFAYDTAPIRERGESLEIPYEEPKHSSILKPPFDRVENRLDTLDVSTMETHLRRYFCIRYGLKDRSLEALLELAENQLVGLLKEDKLLYF